MRYNKYLGLKEVNRAILMMKYDSSLTLNENELYLNEQEGRGSSLQLDPERDRRIEIEKQRQQQLKIDFDSKFVVVKIPPKNSAKANTLILPKGTDFKIWEPNESRVNSYFKSWVGTTLDEYVPEENELRKIFPDGTLHNFKIPDGTEFIGKLKRISDKPLVWDFIWWYNKNGTPYNQNEYLGDTEIPDDYMYKEDGFWDKWGAWIIMATSVALAVLIPPPAGLILSALVELVPAVQQFSEGDNVGGIISVVLALSPFVGSSLIKISSKEAKILAQKFARANPQDINSIYNKLTPELKKAFQSVFRNDPRIMGKEFEKIMWSQITQGLERKLIDPKQLLIEINKQLKTMPYSEVAKWWERTGLKRFGFDISVTAGGLATAYFVGKQEAEKESEKNKEKESKKAVEKIKDPNVKKISKDDYIKQLERGLDSLNNIKQ